MTENEKPEVDLLHNWLIAVSLISAICLGGGLCIMALFGLGYSSMGLGFPLFSADILEDIFVLFSLPYFSMMIPFFALVFAWIAKYKGKRRVSLILSLVSFGTAWIPFSYVCVILSG